MIESLECVTCQLKYFTDDLNADCVSTGDLKCINPANETKVSCADDEVCSVTIKRTRTTEISNLTNEEIELSRSCIRRQDAFHIEKTFAATYNRCSKSNSKNCLIHETVKCFNETDPENNNGECHPGQNGCISCFESEYFDSITQEGGQATGSHENCADLSHLFYSGIDCPSDCQLETSLITDMHFDKAGTNIKNYVEKRTRRGCADVIPFSIRSYSRAEHAVLCENEACQINFESKCFDMVISTTTSTEPTSTTSSTEQILSTTMETAQLITTPSNAVLTTKTEVTVTTATVAALLGEEIAIIILSVCSFLMLFVIVLLLYHLKSLKRKLRSKRIESRNYWIWNLQQPKYH